jgi:hypothetical protein
LVKLKVQSVFFLINDVAEFVPQGENRSLVLGTFHGTKKKEWMTEDDNPLQKQQRKCW